MVPPGNGTIRKLMTIVRDPKEIVESKLPVQPSEQSVSQSIQTAEILEAPCTVSPPIDEFQDNSNVPKYSPVRLFWFFLWRFGLFAWGGPVAQIALIKEQLVMKDKWITIARFNRAFAVYQILPGPEAAELCMFFGCLSGGRLGGIAAGIGFILPGFILMLVASYLYHLVGFGNKYVNSSFRALQPVVAAMVFSLSIFDLHRCCEPRTKLGNILFYHMRPKRLMLFS